MFKFCRKFCACVCVYKIKRAHIHTQQVKHIVMLSNNISISSNSSQRFCCSQSIIFGFVWEVRWRRLSGYTRVLVFGWDNFTHSSSSSTRIYIPISLIGNEHDWTRGVWGCGGGNNIWYPPPNILFFKSNRNRIGGSEDIELKEWHINL